MNLNKLPLLLLALTSATTLRAQTDTTKTDADSASATTFGEATVRATRLMFVTKKDTVVYDLDALNTTRGDMLGDIIDRLPGLELRDGVLYFKGKRVNRLQVNGTDFARGDTQTALAVLPAYIVKHVKAYEGITDQHRVTGLDDGEREQVVDVILRREYLGTWTGNADLGYGTDDRWRERVFANTFTDRMRISVYGGFTNTGQYQYVGDNGSWSDSGGSGSSSGDTRFFRPGTSFMWKNRKKDSETGFLQIDGSLAWDFRGHRDYNENGSETVLDDGTSQFDVSDARSKNDEQQWQSRLSIISRPWKEMYFQFQPSYSHQKQEDRTHSRAATWNGINVAARYAAPLDSIVRHRTGGGWPSTDDGTGAVNLVQGETHSDSQYDMYAHWLYATQRLTEKNLRLSLRQSTNYTKSRDTRNELTQYTWFTPDAASNGMDPLYNRYRRNGSTSVFSQSFLDLNIPVPAFQTLRFTYGYEYSRDRRHNAGYRPDRLGGTYASFDDYLPILGQLPTESGWQLAAREAEITLNSTTRLSRHWAEIQLDYAKNGFYASVQNLLKWRHEELDYLKMDYEPLHPRRNSTEYLVNTKLRYQNDSIGTFELGYFFSREARGLSNYITIPDRSDPLHISLGNPDLPDSRRHSYTARYDRTFPHNRFFSFSLEGNTYITTLVTRSVYNKATGVTTSMPVTVSGHWSAQAVTSFTTPLDKQQRLSLSLYAGYQAEHSPDLIKTTADAPVRITSDWHMAQLLADISARWDKLFVRLAANAGYSRLRSTNASLNGYDQWRNNYQLSVTYKMPWDLELKSDLTVWQNYGVTLDNFRRNQFIWNAWLGKSLLRDRSLTVQFEASDILNQREMVYARRTETGSTWYKSQSVRRYFMLHLIYSFSTKKKG